jgi:hypothetical protein
MQVRNKWRRDYPDIRPALDGARLVGVDLAGADFTDADLKNALLAGADLSGANLSGVKLTEIDLSGSSITWTNFGDADLVIGGGSADRHIILKQPGEKLSKVGLVCNSGILARIASR